MIHWSIIEALKSKNIKEILITTNCSKVKRRKNLIKLKKFQ